MNKFYEQLHKGMSKAEALQQTKIWMRKQSYHVDENNVRIKEDAPIFWAPFILIEY